MEAKRALNSKNIDSDSEVLMEISALRAAFLTLVRLLQIALTSHQ